MSDSVFSLDLNERYIRMCDLTTKKDKIELLSLGYDESIPNFFSTFTDETAQLQAKIISQMRTNLKIKKNKVAVVIPDNYAYSQIIEMPDLKEEELIKAIRYQADEFIPMPIDDVYLDLEILTQNEQTKKLLILIVASAKKVVDQVYKTLELAKLSPESLEIELSALGRFISEVYTFTSEPAVVINFGYTNTSIYVIDPKTSLILLTRTVKIGFELLVRDLKVNLNWDDQKAQTALKSIGLSTNGSLNISTVVYPIIKELLQEVEKSIAQVREKSGLEVKHIYVYNHDTLVANLLPTIQSYFSLPTEVFPISAKLTLNPITQSFSAELTSFVSVIAGNIR